jgi:acyl carrier protein
MSSTYERVRRVVADELSVDINKVGPHTNVIADLNPDSLDVVQIIHALEDEFDVTIGDEAEHLGTIAELAELVDTQVRRKGDLTPIM